MCNFVHVPKGCCSLYMNNLYELAKPPNSAFLLQI